MEQRNRPNAVAFAVPFFIGLMTLTRFSEHVRPVDVLALSGSGAAIGIGIAGFVLSFKLRRKS
jgi:hypothetical protein